MSVFFTALEEACAAWPVRPGGEEMRRMEAFALKVLEANARINLTAITDVEAMARRHFADSLLPLAMGLELSGSCVDVGTGAGFPGVPIAMVCPGVQVTLLDSLHKRTEFLREAQRGIGFRAEIVTMRAEDAGRAEQYRETYDVAVSRAVAPLCVLAELMLPLVRAGGRAMAWKGKITPEELGEAQYALETLGAEAEAFEYHTAWGERSIVVMRKIAPTPAKYPRRPGMPEKRPLVAKE